MSSTARECEEKLHIEDVFKRRSQPGDNTTSMANVLNQQMSQLFHDPRNFIYELLQNAEDANATSIVFTIVNNSLIVSYNGDPFTPHDIERICDVSRDIDSHVTAKPNQEDKIGYKGIGFKSVFGISKEISILSPATNYFFRFSKSHRGKEAEFLSETDPNTRFPWQIIPIWIEESERILSAHESEVTLILEDVDLTKIRPELITLVSQSEILVFLNKIQAISYVEGSARYAINKHTIDSKELIKIDQINPISVTETLWHTYHADIAIEHSLTAMMQGLNLSAKMKSAKFMKISFAVPVAKHGDIYSFIPFTGGRLFCHLPTAVQCHLSFLINAKFTLNQDRSMLLNDERNNFLLEKIAIEQFKWFAKLAQNPFYKKDVLQLLNNQDVADIFPQLKRKEIQEEEQSSLATDLLSAYYRGFKQGFTEVAFILSKNYDLLCLSECVIDTTGFFEEIDERLVDEQLIIQERSRIVAYDLSDRHRLIQFAKEYAEQNLSDNISRYMEKVVESSHKMVRSRIVHFILRSLHSRSFWIKKILLNTNGVLCTPAESFMPPQHGLQGWDLTIFGLDIIATEQYQEDIGTLLSSAIDPLTLEMLICKHLAKMVRDNQINEHNSVEILHFLYQAAAVDPSILPLLRKGSGDVAFSRFKVITQDRQLRELKNCFFPLTTNDVNICPEFQLADNYGIRPDNHANWRDFLACFGIMTSAKLTVEHSEYETIYKYFTYYLPVFCHHFEKYAQDIIGHTSEDDIPASAKAGKKKVGELLKNILFENFLSFPFLFLNTNPSTLNLLYQALNEQQWFITQKPTIRRSGGKSIEIREHFLSYYFRQYIPISVYGKPEPQHSKDLFYLPQLLDCFDPQDLPIDLAEIPIPLTSATADFLGFKRFISLQQGLSLLTSLNQNRGLRALDQNYFLRLRAIYHLIIQIDLAKEDVSIIQPWKQQNTLLSQKKTFVFVEELKIFDELSISAIPQRGHWLHHAGLESHELKKLGSILRIPCHSEDDNFTPEISLDESKIEKIKRLKSFILDFLPFLILKEFQEFNQDTKTLHKRVFDELKGLEFIYCEAFYFENAKHQADVRIKRPYLYVTGRVQTVVAAELGKKFFTSESTRREFKTILTAFSTIDKNNDLLQKKVHAIPSELKSKYNEMLAYHVANMMEEVQQQPAATDTGKKSATLIDSDPGQANHVPLPNNSSKESSTKLASPEATRKEISSQTFVTPALTRVGVALFFDPANSPVTMEPVHSKKESQLAPLGNRPSLTPGSQKKETTSSHDPEEDEDEETVAATEERNKKIGDTGEACVFLKIKHLLREQLQVNPQELDVPMHIGSDSSETITVSSTRFVKNGMNIDLIWFNKNRNEANVHESPVDIIIAVDGENRYFIEVKSTATPKNPMFFLTSNEWRYMREKREKSILVRAYDIEGEKIRFEIYKDPFGMIIKDLIDFMTGGKFRLKIRTAEEAEEHLLKEDSLIGCRVS